MSPFPSLRYHKLTSPSPSRQYHCAHRPKTGTPEDTGRPSIGTKDYSVPGGTCTVSMPHRPALLMLGSTSLFPKCAHCRYVGLVTLLLGAVCPRSEFNQRMKRYLHPRRFLLRHIHVISIDTPQYSLMSDDDDVLASLQLHDDRFKPDDDVAIALSTSVTVIIFVVVTGLEVFRVLIGNFLVRQAIAHAGIKLVESFPFKFVIAFWRCRQEARSLDGPFKRRGPDG